MTAPTGQDAKPHRRSPHITATVNSVTSSYWALDDSTGVGATKYQPHPKTCGGLRRGYFSLETSLVTGWDGHDLNEQARLPLPDRDRSLDEVIADFAGRLCPCGSYGEIDEWSVYDEGFRRLVAWADETERFFEGLQPLKEGGREHDLTYDPVTGTWLKFTKPAAAGYDVSFEFGMPALEPGLPLEYFERLALQNEIFEDQMTYIGIAGERHRPRIVTRQPDIPGEAADPSEIIHLMTNELGFSTLPARFFVGYANSLAFIRDDIGVFDLRPANVVRTLDGIIVPIDSIPVRLDERARRILTG